MSCYQCSLSIEPWFSNDGAISVEQETTVCVCVCACECVTVCVCVSMYTCKCAVYYSVHTNICTVKLLLSLWGHCFINTHTHTHMYIPVLPCVSTQSLPTQVLSTVHVYCDLVYMHLTHKRLLLNWTLILCHFVRTR